MLHILISLVILLIWFGCGFLAFGRAYAYNSDKHYWMGETLSRREAMLLIPLGVIGLFAVLMETRNSSCGWKFTDGCTWVK